jgi:hypothetical protein
MNEPLARAERALVVLIAAHSVAVGLLLTFATEWGARFGGFGPVTPLFFPRQAGAFHFVVAGVYLVEHVRYRGVLLLVAAKSAATLFLGLTILLTPDSAWLVPVSAAGEAAMAVAVVWLRRRRGLPLAGAAA